VRHLQPYQLGAIDGGVLHAAFAECVDEIERLQSELTAARETNRRLNRRCQQAEAMETEYRHAANAMRTEAEQLHERAANSRWWLDRLRRVVRAAEAAERSEG
jgi:FtsZ-binding cell division protein ZapB